MDIQVWPKRRRLSTSPFNIHFYWSKPAWSPRCYSVAQSKADATSSARAWRRIFWGLKRSLGRNFVESSQLPTKKTTLRGLVSLPCDSPFWNWETWGWLRWQEKRPPLFHRNECFWTPIVLKNGFKNQPTSISRNSATQRSGWLKNHKDKMMGCIKTLLQESEACDLSTGTGFQQFIASPGITCCFFQHGLPFPVRSCDPKQHHPKHLAKFKVQHPMHCLQRILPSGHNGNPRFRGLVEESSWVEPVRAAHSPKHQPQNHEKNESILGVLICPIFYSVSHPKSLRRPPSSSKISKSKKKTQIALGGLVGVNCQTVWVIWMFPKIVVPPNHPF